MLKEHNCLILTSEDLSKLRYGTHAQKCKLIHRTESLKYDNISFCPLNISSDIELLCMIKSSSMLFILPFHTIL